MRVTEFVFPAHGSPWPRIGSHLPPMGMWPDPHPFCSSSFWHETSPGPTTTIAMARKTAVGGEGGEIAIVDDMSNNAQLNVTPHSLRAFHMVNCPVK